VIAVFTSSAWSDMTKRRLIIGSLILAVLPAAGLWLFRPVPVNVTASSLTRGSLSITVDEQGYTRASQRYTVTAPVSGQLLRTSIHIGQWVEQGQLLARMAPAPDDPRTEATARAELAAARARQQEIAAQLEEAQNALAYARSEMTRRIELYDKGLVSIETRDQYVQLVDTAKARVASVQASLEAARAQVDSARARLLGVDEMVGETGLIDVVAPVTGQVLQLFEENERVVPAGIPLFELAAGEALELVVDVLTQDAVSIEPGDAIRVSGWGGTDILQGIVRYKEPRAFTRVSTLGVEEQRVNIIGELLDPPASLGAQYRIDASIVTWQQDDVLLIPASAIFRQDEAWHAFVIDEGTARLRTLQLGPRGTRAAVLLDGAVEGERVIVFPSEQVLDGVRVSSDAGGAVS
jgi:HlyD family secretion protein